MTRNRSNMRKQSQCCFQQGYACQMKGQLEAAITWYQRSIALDPSAEAHTFLGWAYSAQARYQEAIAECLKAIQIDPDFGNPYNDIGSYLIALNQPAESVRWFKRALRAARYDSRVLPWFNLGQVAEWNWDYPQARDCYGRAIEADPSYQPAWEGYFRVSALMN